jgi:aminoglycoside phosphotransferase (APT) family kinase protein
LVDAAAGVPLLSFVGQSTPDVRRYVRQAARWLVRLHRAPLRIGRRESSWDSLRLLKIVRRMTKAAARAPQERARLIEMVDALCDQAREAPDAALCVQTHGRYHSEHIFVSGETTTLIDFDRSCPSDPAKDLAEFVSMLRLRTFKHAGTTAPADVPTQIFLDEYLSHLPRNGQNLAIHWGAYLLLNMCHYVKKSDPANEFFPSMLRFYLQEFEAALGGTFARGA